MNLKKVKSVQDQGTHFVVDHETHGRFKVLKKDLDKLTQAKIARLCSGGMVRHYDEGGYVPAQPVAPDPVDPQDVPNPDTGITPRQFAAATANNPEYNLNDNTRAASLGINPVPDIKDTDQVVAGPAPTSLESALGMPPAAPSQLGPTQSPQAAPAPAQQAPQAAAAPKLPTMPSAAGIFGDLDKQAQAIRNSANITGKEEGEKQATYQNYLAQKQTHDAAFATSMKSQDAEYKQLHDDVANSKINPNRLWQSMSTGNKVLAAISMVLGGIGAGAGGHNQAVAVIQDAINRDIDAQKTDLGKKQSLLSDNLRKTGDLREAERLTQAQMLATVQGQVTVIGSKYGGAKAQAQADLLANGIAEKRDRLKYDIASNRAIAAAQLTQQQQLAQAYDRLSKGVGTPADEAVLGDKMAAMVVDTPTGRALAHDPEAAKEYRKTQAELAPLQGHIQRLKEMGREAAGGNWTQASRQAFESEREGALSELGHLAGLSRFTPEEKKIFETRIRNLNDPLQFRSGFEAGINGLQQEVQDKSLGQSNTYLRRPALRAVKKAE